ncbi:hypothetical protein ACJRO7_021378 [Eucalyptus globulus]|uniref:TIR domain-containing protein n=1 Tax=Eucalyptus globulus TaxID=34317 RepID=A0ABD3KJM5_EUCGL
MGNPGSEAVEHLPEQSRLSFCFKPLIFLARLLARLFLSLFSEAWHSREAHVPSALLTVASSNMKRNYHVFLSFRGTDVRQGFLSHLYAALDQKGIFTFVDSEELRKGEQISPALMRAIEESHVAIIVFSEHYASSRWCLEELLKIMECKEKNGLMVFPVFYKVEPREVRGGRESYKRAMNNHESNFGKDSEKVKRWKRALLDAGNLSGWHFNDRDDEAELIQSIVNELSICLRPRSLYVAKYPVGIESQVQKLISLSEPAGSDVLMIGLWGPGGIGKTTIAKALYNAIENQFQGCIFLAKVREKSNQSGGLVDLQRQLLSEILPYKELMVYSVHRGISLIQERLCCKKVLLVLDDVDKMDQLNALAGKGDWFGEGSRIIVTSRDQHLLTSHGINCVYEVKTLEYDDALNLFGQHAFPNSKVEIRWDLIDRALHYANGLPLALEVLGSFLCGRNEAAWESALRRLSKSPDQTINQVLKISFDGLDSNEREIFLDIACFFKGERIEYVQEVLDGCGFDTTIGIEILIERSLIKKEYDGTLQMHDLIQLMGKNIVNQEWPDDPGKRSRLWLFEDVQNVFYEDTGTNAVKAIVLNLPAPEEMIISPGAFTNMKRLRILILFNVHISSQGPIPLPNELGWLEWPNPPDLEFVPGAKKLVRLHFENSSIKLGGNCQNFICLKSIKIVDCKYLASVLDFSSAPLLESLYILRCKRLVEVHLYVGDLDKLKHLTVSECSKLRIFPNTLKTKSLQMLDLSNCFKLEKCPDILGKMEHLEYFDLRGTAIKEVPASIENLVSVKIINLGYCKNLTRLPSNIRKLKNLETLYLGSCSNLAMFPKYLEDSIDPDGDLGFPNLRWLDLNGCNLSEAEFLENASSCPKLTHLNLSNNKFTHLPTCFNKYDHWKDLFVYSCKQSKGVSEDDASSPKEVRILANGSEMPEWILHREEDSISFMVPPDLDDKCLGLALCFILGRYKKRRFGMPFEVIIFVNGERQYWSNCNFSPMEADHVRLLYIPTKNKRGEEEPLQNQTLLYIPTKNKRGEEEPLQNDWSHVQVCLRTPRGSIKKRGFRFICEQQEDDLRIRFPTLSADGNELEFQGRILERRQFSEEYEDEDTQDEIVSSDDESTGSTDATS